MTFKGDYIVAAWKDFQELGLDAKVPVHVVRELIVPDEMRFPIADAERAMGLRLPLPAGEEQQQQQLPAEHSAQDMVVSEPVDPPPPTAGASESTDAAGVKFHDIRPYAGSLRAKFAPWLTSQQWIALGKKGRKDLIDKAMAEEVAADEEEVALAAAHIIECCTSPDSKMGDPKHVRHGCTVTG